MRKKTQSKPSLPTIPLPALAIEEELELDYDVCCSIEEIESIISKSCPEKQKKLAEVSLKILKNPGESHIRKKQVMRQWFGDYKKKFENKKKQVHASLNSNKCQIITPRTECKSVCIRKYKVKNCERSSDCVGELVSQTNLYLKVSNEPFKFEF